MTDSSRVTVRVTRRFRFPVERVFDAWLRPELIRSWMLPHSEAVVRVEVDARVGGRFSFVVLRQGEEIDHSGEYLELDRPHKLSFTWGVPKFGAEVTLVRIEFTPLADGSELTLTHERVFPDYEQRTAQGWNTIIDALAAALG